MPISRRAFLVAAVAGAVDSACAPAIVDAPCTSCPPPGCLSANPIPTGLPAERCELFAYDELHRATATVYRPTTEAELAQLLKSVPEGRHVTLRGGGNSLDSQALNDDVVIILGGEWFHRIGMPQRDDAGFFITTGAAARWWDVIDRVASFGLMPPSVMTAGDATVGGTMSADCLSRLSPVSGKEGGQIRSFRIVLADGRVLACSRDDAADSEQGVLFQAVIGGFGYLGAVTEVTFDLLVARSNPGTKGAKPTVLTRSTRHGPNVDWDTALRSLVSKTDAARTNFAAHRASHHGALAKEAASDPAPLARTPEWSALSIASFLTGSGMSANLLEQRFVEAPLHPMPGGVYDKAASFTATSARLTPRIPTIIELALEIGFPEGEFVDELFGWAFFMGNWSKKAKADAHACGDRMNFTQQTFLLPTGPDDRRPDTRTARRFIDLVETRLHEADARPATIDFLYVPKDRFLMSASRGLSSFVITITFADRNKLRLAPEIHDMLCALTHDCRTLGGRVHLIKSVVADRADLRAMHGDAAAELRALKRRFDPRGIFRNEFFARVFEA